MYLGRRAVVEVMNEDRASLCGTHPPRGRIIVLCATISVMSLAASGCPRSQKSMAIVPIEGVDAREAAGQPVIEFPAVARIERYCLAITKCVPAFAYGSSEPLGADAFAKCVREVTLTISSTTLIERPFGWLDQCGRGLDDCGHLAVCGVDRNAVTYCLRSAVTGTTGCMAIATKLDQSPVVLDILVSCPSRFLALATDCRAVGQSCSGGVWGKSCTAAEPCEDDSETWSCRGRERVRCVDGLLRTLPCEGDRACELVAGAAVCLPKGRPCSDSPSCKDGVASTCVSGMKRSVLCKNGWRCKAGGQAGAPPCEIDSVSTCDESNFQSHCDGDDIEYCLLGRLRRVSCGDGPRKMKCRESPGVGPVCAD
jgi:hypothetical protein